MTATSASDRHQVRLRPEQRHLRRLLRLRQARRARDGPRAGPLLRSGRRLRTAFDSLPLLRRRVQLHGRPLVLLHRRVQNEPGHLQQHRERRPATTGPPEPTSTDIRGAPLPTASSTRFRRPNMTALDVIGWGTSRATGGGFTISLPSFSNIGQAVDAAAVRGVDAGAPERGAARPSARAALPLRLVAPPRRATAHAFRALEHCLELIRHDVAARCCAAWVRRNRVT